MPLMKDAQDPVSATNSGKLDQTIQPLPTPDMGDQDIRDWPSNGAIPDAVRAIIPPTGFHVP